MATIKDVMDDAQKEWEQELGQKDKELMEKINIIIRLLKGTGISGFGGYNKVKLSQIAGDLANYKFSLAESLSITNRSMKITEDYYKMRKYTSRENIIKELISELGRKPVKDDIDAEIEKNAFKLKFLHTLKEAHYNKLKNYYYTISEMLDVIKQRIMVIMSEESANKFGDNELGMENKLDWQPENKDFYKKVDNGNVKPV